MKHNIRSEINPLRLVITHRPGEEHELVTPLNLVEHIHSGKDLITNPDYLLFDDIIYVLSLIHISETTRRTPI